MRHAQSQKYCANPHELATMARDGIGWGHDLHCGTFRAPKAPHATAFQFGRRRVK